MKKANIAIILARGGSKRIPGKNIVNFHGKPLVYWTISAALDSKQFDKVVVSTDSLQVADISISHGAEVPFLRTSAADDLTPTSEATLFALKQAEEFWDCTFENVTQLMANCPLRNSTDIANAVDHFYANSFSSQISCFRFGWMNPWWAFELNSDSSGSSKFPQEIKMRSQDLPDLYCPSGAIWISTRQHLLQHKSYYSADTKYFELDWISSLDIDSYDDLAMATACFNLRSS